MRWLGGVYWLRRVLLCEGRKGVEGLHRCFLPFDVAPT